MRAGVNVAVEVVLAFVRGRHFPAAARWGEEKELVVAGPHKETVPALGIRDGGIQVYVRSCRVAQIDLDTFYTALGTVLPSVLVDVVPGIVADFYRAIFNDHAEREVLDRFALRRVEGVEPGRQGVKPYAECRRVNGAHPLVVEEIGKRTGDRSAQRRGVRAVVEAERIGQSTLYPRVAAGIFQGQRLAPVGQVDVVPDPIHVAEVILVDPGLYFGQDGAGGHGQGGCRWGRAAAQVHAVLGGDAPDIAGDAAEHNAVGKLSVAPCGGVVEADAARGRNRLRFRYQPRIPAQIGLPGADLEHRGHIGIAVGIAVRFVAFPNVVARQLEGIGDSEGDFIAARRYDELVLALGIGAGAQRRRKVGYAADGRDGHGDVANPFFADVLYAVAVLVKPDTVAH